MIWFITFINFEPSYQSDVEFELRRRDISYWDVKAQKWAVAPGTYTFMLVLVREI
jgi:beta-glucosidase